MVFGVFVWISVVLSTMLDGLLAEAEEIRGHSVASSTRGIYDSNMRVYENVMRNEIGTDPMPITVDKMVGFLVLMKRKGRTCNTLLNYARAFSYYFRSNNLELLTQDMRFKVFLTGLRRKMADNGETAKAKEPFLVEWFGDIARVRPMEDIASRMLMLCMMIAFYGFLRISELMALRKRDIRINEIDGRMEMYIRRSKTDQFGRGEVAYVYKGEGEGNPWQYKDVLETIEDDEYLVGGLRDWELRKLLKGMLIDIGVQDVQNYSFHSFRRGGAHLASVRGVADAKIKAHGRWKSEAYIRYVAVDQRQAGMEVGLALDGKSAPQ